TVGAIGCCSLKDGKILACGEGGYLLTDDHALAAQAASWRNHGLTAAPGAAAGTRLGHNFRLAQPLAALAPYHPTPFDTPPSPPPPPASAPAPPPRDPPPARLIPALADPPGPKPLPAPTGHNGYSPVWHISLPKPRAFATRLSELGVVNSVGTFGLRAAPLQPWCSPMEPAPCPNAAQLLDQLLAITLTARHQDHDLDELAALVDREARAWA